MVFLQLSRAARRILDRIPVAGQRNPRRQLDRPVERREVVAQRIGTARRPEPDRRRDPPEQMIRGDQHAVAKEAELPVGVTGCGDELPAVDLLARLDEDRVALVADERPVHGALADELVRDVVGRAVEPEPVDEPLRPGGVPPDELALRVVERPLYDRRAGQLVEVGRRPDVVRMEVRDEDRRDAASCLLELEQPTSPSRREARPRCRRASNRPRREGGTCGRAPAASAAAA